MRQRERASRIVSATSDFYLPSAAASQGRFRKSLRSIFWIFALKLLHEGDKITSDSSEFHAGTTLTAKKFLLVSSRAHWCLSFCILPLVRTFVSASKKSENFRLRDRWLSGSTTSSHCEGDAVSSCADQFFVAWHRMVNPITLIDVL